MPNWCDNRVVFSHDDSTMIDGLAEAIQKERLCEYAVPVPQGLDYSGTQEEQLANKNRFGVQSGYLFRVFNWGTKWDIDGAEVSRVGNKVTATFCTAWAPPIGVYEALAVKGFNIEARYYEGGACFAGVWRSDTGDTCVDFSDLRDAASVKAALDKADPHLDDTFGISEFMEEDVNEAEDVNEIEVVNT